MKKLDELERRTNIGEAPLEILPIISTLKCFEKVVQDCFSTKLGPNLEINFHLLKESFMHLQEYAVNQNYKLSVTWRVHILF